MAREAESLAQFFQRRRAVMCRRRFLNAHHEKARDYGQIAQAVQQETPALADHRHQSSGNCRACHARAVEHRGVQGNGIQ